VRIVPGGSSIRDAAISARAWCACRPCTINVGAWVDDGTMVDSHALVGSCAQVGRNCHISARQPDRRRAGAGGRHAGDRGGRRLVGGIAASTKAPWSSARAVLGTGTILNRSTPVYDLVHSIIHRATDERSRSSSPKRPWWWPFARALEAARGKTGNSVYTPVIREVPGRPDRHQDPA